MARRQLKGILSSGFKNIYLELLSSYLEKQMNRLQIQTLNDDEKKLLLKELETTNAAIRQYAIAYPINETLFIPPNLNSDQIEILKNILIKTKKAKRHLKLARSA